MLVILLIGVLRLLILLLIFVSVIIVNIGRLMVVMRKLNVVV